MARSTAALVIAVSNLLCATGAAAQETASSQATDDAVTAALDSVSADSSPTQTPAPAPSAAALKLMVGQVEPIPTHDLKRVAVGDPAVADVVILSENELLIRAEHRGATTLLVWDANGQRQWDVTVEGEDRVPGLMTSLRRMLDTERFTQLTLHSEGGQVYVSGRLNNDLEKQRLDKLLETFPNTVSLAQVAVATEQTLPLVELEVQVIEVSKSAVQNLGLDWSNQTTLDEIPFTAASTDLVEALAHRVADIVRIGALKRSAFQVVLNHMLDEGKARIIAATNQVTLSGKPASSSLGGEIPVISSTSVSSGTVTQSVEFKPIGALLTVTPTVSMDLKKINAIVEAELRAVDLTNAITISGNTVPGFKVRKTKTEVAGKPEETIVIAGLLQDEESQADAKVPKLASVPLFGRLFRNANYRMAQTELLVAVTPRLVHGHSVTKLADLQRASTLSSSAPPPAPPASSADTSAAAAQAQGLPSLDPTTSYARQIQERVAHGLENPLPSTVGNGAVQLQLHLLADGTLEDVRVIKSSGDRLLDETAAAAALSQGPYPAFPTAVSHRELWLEFPVIFNPS